MVVGRRKKPGRVALGCGRAHHPARGGMGRRGSVARDGAQTLGVVARRLSQASYLCIRMNTMAIAKYCRPIAIVRSPKGMELPVWLTVPIIRFVNGAPIWCERRCRSVVMSPCMRCGSVLSLMPIMRNGPVSGSISNYLTTTWRWGSLRRGARGLYRRW